MPAKDSIDLTHSPTRRAKNAIMIPPALRNTILPHAKLSVLALLRFSILPGPCPFLEPNLYAPESWLSDLPPDGSFQADCLARIALPPKAVVEELHTALLSGSNAKSITVAHLPAELGLPKQLPLWAASYWRDAHMARIARQRWREALEWAEHRTAGSTRGREELASLRQNLAYLGWGDRFRGVLCTATALSGVSDYMPAYLSDSRLRGSHIDQLVACTQEALIEKSHRDSHSITGPDLVADIIRASQDTPENLSDPQQYSALRRLEFDLVNGHRSGLGAIAFINGNHYTFVVLDIHEEYLGYADSMGNLMPEDLRRGFLWWISRLHQQGMPQHRNSPVDQWVRRIPVAPQAIYDDFSCGMLAVNALRHHYLPDVALVKPSRSALSLERIEAFNTVCRTHLDAVSRSQIAWEQP